MTNRTAHQCAVLLRGHYFDRHIFNRRAVTRDCCGQVGKFGPGLSACSRCKMTLSNPTPTNAFYRI